MTACAPTPMSTGELACIQSVLEDTLPAAATIRRATTSSDSAGGQTSTWADVHTAVPCRVVPQGGDETVHDGRWQTRVAYRISMPAGTDVRATDRIVVDATTTFEVTAVLRRWTETVRTVLAVEITP